MPQPTDSEWPGRRLGLPPEGPRSIARLGRRLAAFAVDWGIAVVVSTAFFSYDAFANLGLYALIQVLFIPTLGGSVGHLLLGLRVVPVAGGWVGVWRPILRTALIAVVIPAVIWDRDQRGLHDLAAGTLLVRR